MPPVRTHPDRTPPGPAPPGPAPARLVLGIDPDVERPGVAVYDPQAHRLVFCGAVPLRRLVAWLRDGAAPARLPGPRGADADARTGAALALACVEDTRDRPLYARHRAAAASPAARDRMARSVGRLDEVTRLLLDELVDAGIPARSCSPVRKLDADAFARLTGYAGRTGQEARDAGALCFGVAAPDRHAPGRAGLRGG